MFACFVSSFLDQGLSKYVFVWFFPLPALLPQSASSQPSITTLPNYSLLICLWGFLSPHWLHFYKSWLVTTIISFLQDYCHTLAVSWLSCSKLDSFQIHFLSWPLKWLATWANQILSLALWTPLMSHCTQDNISSLGVYQASLWSYPLHISSCSSCKSPFYQHWITYRPCLPKHRIHVHAPPPPSHSWSSHTLSTPPAIILFLVTSHSSRLS